MKTFRILLGDDHHIVRQGLQLIIDDVIPDAEIVHASNLSELLGEVEKSPFDLAVVDAQFPDGNSLSVLPELKQFQPHLKILIFTSFEEEMYALKFVEAGADGFLNKLSTEEDIESALREIKETGNSFPPLTKKLLQLPEEQVALLNPLHQLSDRELEIAVLYADGLGNLEIANQLAIRQNTVSTYKKRIFEKLQIHTLIELTDLIRLHHSL